MGWTLCSIAGPAQVLPEIRRAPRPRGELLFPSTGAPPNLRRALAGRLTPAWRTIAGGCDLDRPIRESGLRVVEHDTGHFVKGPRFAAYDYRGRAIA